MQKRLAFMAENSGKVKKRDEKMGEKFFFEISWR